MGRGLLTLGLEDPEDAAGAAESDSGPAPISGPVVAPPAGRGGMAVSAVIHVLLIALAVQVAIVHAPEAPRPVAAHTPSANAVFLPPPAQVRKMLGLRPLPPRPTPPPPGAKDRISLGAPAPMRTPEPLILNRDDDLTKIAKGLPTASQEPRPAMPEPAPPLPAARPAGAILSDDGRLSPTRLTAGRPGPIQASLQRFEASTSRIGDPGPLGAVTGTGGQMGPLFFDPQGADFTEWVQRFKNEVYRNWILPPSAALGGTGQVDFEFVVDRNGTMTEVRLLESSGTPSYDRAARNALLASLLLPLPKDFAPATVAMRVGFVYGMRPPDSGRAGR